ncbi:putative translation elongation factor g protein [Phaeoacremonium minimum UCRPA7]|uniref:Elongation factor 2 n=1 Tax=Phaeoacremonium minimum (strain UCR-PA7) TaxID=1286976 RepID=R8BUT9_PHAM7|nr:putative translation elongation factor g protein [Phaeoacremonium minimum UCRPA7]EOO03132.1 putative translation elongation factor g protein [Phaeoacremonium minimum UCRPA7]
MLYYSGVTRRLGNVDNGDTITDFLPLERERGITIQSAAISFNWPPKETCPPGVESKTINLIDTPGHQDFRFEVDRCLPVLDGAVCIIDSVKGVEAHTERVWTSAQQFKIPRIIFVNKLDRVGASFKKSVLDIASRLNAFPVICQIPWWEKDEFVGVIDVIKRVGYKWTTADSRKTYPYTLLEAMLKTDNPNLLTEINLAREKLVERLCDEDDELTLEFAETGADVSSESIKKSIRRVIMDGEGTVVPVFAGASLRNIGVEPLLDAVVDYLPNPDDRPDLEIRVGPATHYLKEFLVQEGAKSKQKGSKFAHQSPVAAVASVFKVFNDPQRGMLSFVRVYHGTLNRNSATWNSNVHLSEKSHNMLQISANLTQEIPHLTTGSIGAITGLKTARTGDTLIAFPGQKTADAALKSIQIRPVQIPPAVAFIAIEPFSITAQQTLEKALESASREDPSLRWNKDEAADQFILSGMGKLHLDIAIDNLKKNYKIEATFGEIEVDYKECLTAPVPPQSFTYDKAVAGKTGKAACKATLEPLEEHHQETILESSVERDGNIIHVQIPLPRDTSGLQFDPEMVRQQLQNGAISALYRGPRRGSPVQGCHVTITFDPETDFFGPTPGSHFVNAAYHAVRNALRDAYSKKQIGILEPVMKVRIQCPEEVAGVVQHDLSSGRGGHVLEINDLNNAVSTESPVDLSQVYSPPDPYESIASLRDPKKGITRMLELVARVPLKEMLEYDSHLRGKTAGRHSLSMDLDTFEKVTGPREKAL